MTTIEPKKIGCAHCTFETWTPAEFTTHMVTSGHGLSDEIRQDLMDSGALAEFEQAVSMLQRAVPGHVGRFEANAIDESTLSDEERALLERVRAHEMARAAGRSVTLPLAEILAMPRLLYRALYRGWRELPTEMSAHNTGSDAMRGQMALDAAAVLLGVLCMACGLSDEEFMREQRALWVHVFGEEYTEDEMRLVQLAVDALMRHAMKESPHERGQ